MHRVFDLSDAYPDEKDDVRKILHRNGISFYETPAAEFGRSASAIWVSSELDAIRAIELIKNYQEQRGSRLRAGVVRQRARGAVEDKRSQHYKDAGQKKMMDIAAVVLIVFVIVMVLITGAQRSLI